MIVCTGVDKVYSVLELVEALAGRTGREGAEEPTTAGAGAGDLLVYAQMADLRTHYDETLQVIAVDDSLATTLALAAMNPAFRICRSFLKSRCDAGPVYL